MSGVRNLRLGDRISVHGPQSHPAVLCYGAFALPCPPCMASQPLGTPLGHHWWLHVPLPPTARSERYRHLGSEDEETNDEESSTEIPQFSSCSHRFSKVGPGRAVAQEELHGATLPRLCGGCLFLCQGSHSGAPATGPHPSLSCILLETGSR